MSLPELRCYDYVNHPYAAVRAALLADPLGVFRSATAASAGRAEALGAALRVRVGPFDIAADVAIRVAGVEEQVSPLGSPATRLMLEWQAQRNSGLFPSMTAGLLVYALTSTETQLELAGTYVPPLGVVGRAADAVVGHLIAEASVLRFLNEVAEYLRRELRPPGAPAIP